MRILLVEDEALIALSTETTLIEAGHFVIGPYKTSEDALAAAEREKPDIAVVDINLAGHNEGLGIARELHDRFGVPSIFATGQANLARANRAVAMGLLIKPYSDHDLVDAFPVLEHLLAGRASPSPRIPSGLELFR